LEIYFIFILRVKRSHYVRREGLEIPTLIQKKNNIHRWIFYEDLKVQINPMNTQIRNCNKKIQRVHIQDKYN
jgi:hypothetical protein